MGKRSRVAVACALLALLLSSMQPVLAAPTGFRLGLGGSAFWSAASQKPALHSSGYRRQWTIDVAPRGYRLRVAIDFASFYRQHDLHLIDPNGARIEGAGGWFSAETYVARPTGGRWRIVVDSPIDKPEYRLRVMLERVKPRTSGPKRAMLPNIRMIPPFEFTFRPPTIPDAGLPAGNCHADEIAEHQAVRCLRFSLGPINSGEGPFEMRFSDDPTGAAVSVPAFQSIHYTDGSVVERKAGEAQYHKTHMHYHHTGFGTLELLRVTDARKGTTTPAGTGPKQGFCTADIVLYEWHRFGPNQNSARTECIGDMLPLPVFGTFAPTGTQMGITAGWADVYEWSQPGNYVEFGLNPDGRYVVRATADSAGHIVESNERDNVSYAYIEVTGNSVKVLERGFGTGPWDPRKVRAADLLLPAPIAR